MFFIFPIFQSLDWIFYSIDLTKRALTAMLDILPNISAYGWACLSHGSNSKSLIFLSIFQSVVDHVEPIVLMERAWTAMLDIYPFILVTG